MGACYDKADQWSSAIHEGLSSRSVRAADFLVAGAHYHRDFVNGRVLPGPAQKIKTKSSPANDPLLSLQHELQSNRSAIWDSIQLLEQYPELAVKAMCHSAWC